MSERELAARLAGDPDLALALDPPVPARIGRYEVLGLLGSGATSDVFRARDPLLGREVALKLLLVAAPDALERFQREVQVLAALSHPHIVPIHDAGLEGERPWFVMELIPGGALDPAALEPPALARTLEAVARALAAAHARGVVHRDLKPPNVLLDARGPRVADFGVAKLLDAGPDAGALVGTLPYMAPEQLRGEAIGPPADVWALGVMLHEGLAGQLPFGGATLAELQASVEAGPPPLPATPPLRPAPAGLVALARRALAPRPEARPGAGELAEALAAWLAADGEPPRPARRPRLPARGATVGALGLGAALLAGAWGLARLGWSTRAAARIEAARGDLERAPRSSPAQLAAIASQLELVLLEALRPPERHEALAALGRARLEQGRAEAALRALEEALLIPGPRQAECLLLRARLQADAAVLLALRGEGPWTGWAEDLSRARALGLSPALALQAAGLEALARTLERHVSDDDDDDDDPPPPLPAGWPGTEPAGQQIAAELALLDGRAEEAQALLERIDAQTGWAQTAALAALGGAEAAEGPRAQDLARALLAVRRDPELGAPVLGHLLRWAILLELGDRPRLPVPVELAAPAGLAEVQGLLISEPLARASLDLFRLTRDRPAPAWEARLTAAAALLSEEDGLESEAARALIELLRARACTGELREEAEDELHERLEGLLESGSGQREIELLEEVAGD